MQSTRVRQPGGGRLRVPRRNVSEVVGDHIRELVFRGELRDGDRVPQREIAEALGVSSVPVREAIAALQREGVVTIEPSRGAFVNGLDEHVVREQFYVFGRIYGLAVRVATARAEAALVARLAALAGEVAGERDLDRLLDLSIRFELAILTAGGSKRLRALFAPLSRIVPGNFYETVPGSADATREGIARMMAAITAGDSESAERACWRLIDEIGELAARALPASQEVGDGSN